jgi:hypothetical protein
MSKPPRSKIAMLFYFFGGLWIVGIIGATLYAHIGETSANSPNYYAKYIAVLFSLPVAFPKFFDGWATIAFGYVVQMISDIRWKLFHGDDNA